MNYKVIEEIASGDVSLRIIQPDLNDWSSRKYWLKAGFGHLEFDPDGMADLEYVMNEFVANPKARKVHSLQNSITGWIWPAVAVLALIDLILVGSHYVGLF